MESGQERCVNNVLLKPIITNIKTKVKRKKFWVNPTNSKRLLAGQFYKLHSELIEQPAKFFKFYKMRKDTFDDLLKLVGPRITYKNTQMRKCIPPEERLSVTLRYLASGNSLNSLHTEYLLGTTTTREIVKDTCRELWNSLQPIHMVEKSEAEWMDIAQQFYERTNFPNCIGVVDAKHIQIKIPVVSSSEVHSSKNYCTIVLLAIVDADYCFTIINVLVDGLDGETNVFKTCDFARRLNNNELNVPKAQNLPEDDTGRSMPFVIVADEAFGLSEHVMRPYPKRNLTETQRVYNYRVTRAHRMVQYAFAILSNKWRVFHRALDVNKEFSTEIIKACCVLHNFVRRKDGVLFEDESFECPLRSSRPIGTRANKPGIIVRDYFANYFTTPQGSVPWQYN